MTRDHKQARRLMRQWFYQRTHLWAVSLVCVACAIGVSVWQNGYLDRRDPSTLEAQKVSESMDEAQKRQGNSNGPATESLEPFFDSWQLQSSIDAWVGGLSGEASVLVSDENGRVLASHNADRVYFAASLYKLFVAYFGYAWIDEGVVAGEEVYLGTQTRIQCLDAMIQDSDSPCSEKMWVEIGAERLTDLLIERGISNTSMTAISTSARDTAQILSLFSKGEGLSKESQAAFLAAAKEQIFRDALNKGFSSSLTVFNKVGFNELKEYHDAAIVELPDGRRFIIAVLTENVGTRNIAELARRVEAILLPSS